jgi:gamma-glutamyltranspeptidase
MLNTPRGTQGMVVAPHHLAAQAGLAVLREGGDAVEAMVAAASTVAVVYPHMNSIGGDNFWLIAEPAKAPVAIMACGGAGERATADFYRGHSSIPPRGPLAANTVAGAISGWDAALAVSKRWGGRLPLSRILADAISYGRHGAPVTVSQHRNTTAKLAELKDVPGYATQFLVNGQPPAVASLFRQPRLAATLERLARAGLDDFYRGEIAAANAAELARIGSPVTAADLRTHRAVETAPLRVDLRCGAVYNVPPPTQGLASLMILGVFDRLGCAEAEGFAFLHGLVESTKQAFLVRDRIVTDPAYMTEDPASHLTESRLTTMASRISPGRAMPWPAPAQGGDTVWLGVIDGQGRELLAVGDRLERPPSWPKAFPHAEPRHGPTRGWSAHGLWDDGRGGAAPDAGGRLRPACPVRARTAGGRHRAALAAGTDLGSGEHEPEGGEPIRSLGDRGAPENRPRRRGGGAFHRYHGSRGRHRPAPVERSGRRRGSAR